MNATGKVRVGVPFVTLARPLRESVIERSEHAWRGTMRVRTTSLWYVGFAKKTDTDTKIEITSSIKNNSIDAKK